MEAGAGVEEMPGRSTEEGGRGRIKARSHVSGLNSWVDSGSTCCYAAEIQEMNRR